MFKFVILATILASVSAGLIGAPLVAAPAGPLLAAAPVIRTPVVAPIATPVIAKTLVAHAPIIDHTPVHVVHPAPLLAGPAFVKAAPITVIH
ncbi:larval/pupal cuticle protein H1C-like [Belonocnema kinseyi]|uniref:larval/pupal cuticle protein H1C-like n=1 Tax=Belonocnema kinseyi TaxID=2817044 RepID=UPI00143D49C9|nr:larval/pupal cuticle protein H1C-like [Belonocnema kinseyi]